MSNESVEKTLSQFFLLGLPFATLFLLTGSVTDPVNVTKLFASGCVSFGVFAIALIYGSREIWRTSKLLPVFALAFLGFSINSAIQSESPFSQNIYGVYGRQTGLLTYVILILIALSATLLRAKKSFNRVIWALLISGAVNILYAGWAILFGDFIDWSNPYGNILGFFGNPNFVGSFLGMFIGCAIAFALSNHFSWKYRSAFAILGVIALYEIKESHAVQGLVVTGASLSIIGFYQVRARTRGLTLTSFYVLFVGTIGAFAAAGALQRGPLASIIYKTSISLRGQYWNAAITMGKDHPLTGVGMDSYGDWFRRARSQYAATILPGPKTVSNAAHNVVLDIFAYGGFPLLISYLAMLTLGIFVIIRVTLRNRAYDGTFVALTTTWVAYQLQSIISINQVGLAIWGWVLLGALIAYEFSTRSNILAEKQSKTTREKELIFSPQLVGGIGILVGAMVSVPPLSADMKWRSALKAQSVQAIEAALVPSYLNPLDSARLAQATYIFQQSKLDDLAYKYARIGVEFNPNYSDAWQLLYVSSKSSNEEKAEALSNMKRLDPYNSDILK